VVYSLVSFDQHVFRRRQGSTFALLLKRATRVISPCLLACVRCAGLPPSHGCWQCPHACTDQLLLVGCPSDSVKMPVLTRAAPSNPCCQSLVTKWKLASEHLVRRLRVPVRSAVGDHSIIYTHYLLVCDGGVATCVSLCAASELVAHSRATSGSIDLQL
jgi:hypothetical protein